MKETLCIAKQKKKPHVICAPLVVNVPESSLQDEMNIHENSFSNFL